jgi:hypothetical protein
LSAHFPDVYLYFLFLFFSITEVTKILLARNGKNSGVVVRVIEQQHTTVCGEELIAQLCCVMSGGTRESFGKMGKPVRAEMMLIEAGF